MSDRRFGDDFERALLDSARSDRMTPERKRALAIAMGAASGATVIAATGAGAASVSAAKAKGALGLALLKWFAVGAVGSVVAASATVGAARVYASHEAERTVAYDDRSHEGPRPPAPARRRIEAAPVASAEAAPVATTPPTTAPADDDTAAPPPARSAARATQAPTLADEVALVARARTALRAGDLAGASDALDAHDRAFPRGALAEEAEALRVEIASRSGDGPRAERLARAFLTRHPSSPHAARVRTLAGGAAP